VTVQFLEAARDDLRDAIWFYETERRGLGAEFRDEVQAALERIVRFPEAGRMLSENTRRCRTHRFPYTTNLENLVRCARFHNLPWHQSWDRQ
jgi:plasmid stabilization system protein ParE